jgi:hypothetical protein
MRAFVVDQPRSGALRALNYSPAIERIRRAGSSSARSLRQIVKVFGPAYGVAFARRDCDPDQGVELLSQSDIFAAEPAGRMIRRDSMPRPERHLIEPGQVLIAGTGTLGENELYGRSLIADERLVGKYLSQDAMALVFEEPEADVSLFTYAWLASPTGTQALRSTSYGTKLLRLRKELLSTIPVPLADAATMKRVAALVRSVVRHRERFLRDLREAREVVERHPDVREAHNICASRQRRVAVWNGPLPTLCAWNFASTGDALSLLRQRWAGRLRDVIEAGGIFRGGRGPRIPCCAPHGVDFLSQRDAFLIRPVPQRVLLPSTGLIPRAGTLMVGGQGTLGEGELFGRTTLVSVDGAKKAWTEHLLRIVPRAGYEATLFAFLTTTVGFRLVRSTAVGTKLLSLRPDLLQDVPIPDLSSDDAQRVDALVRSSLVARSRADGDEAQAIRIIEEEVLPQWLA